MHSVGEKILYNLVLWKYLDIKYPFKFKTALFVLHPKQFQMLSVFVDELNLWLLSLCLYAKAVRLGSSISRCLHITYGFKGIFSLPKHFSESGVVLETFCVILPFLRASIFWNHSSLKFLIKCCVSSHTRTKLLLESFHSEVVEAVAVY